MEFQIAITISLLIYWGVSVAALRQACKECGESDVSIARIVGIGSAHCAGVISFCFVVAGLGMTGMISSIVSVALGVVIIAVLVRFILPTSTKQAVTITICHFLMMIPVMIVLVIGFTIWVMWIAIHSG